MKKVLILALALVLLLGITAHGTFGLFSDTETSTGNTFTAWVEEVVCAKFNVSDKSNGKIYKYDYPPRTFVGSFDLSGDNGSPLGVAAVGDYVYVIDHADKQVYKYTCSGTLVDVSKKLLKSGPSSIGNIDGLAIDGTEMWVLSGNDTNIYQYTLSVAFPDDGSSLPATIEIGLDEDNKGAAGLAIDSSYLYVVDYSTSTPKETRFYQYRRSDGALTAVSKVLNDMASNPLQSPAGAMFDGTSLWVVDSGTNMMYEYDIADLFGSGTINATSEFALDSANTDASGV